MIITAAYGIGTELGLWATLTPVSLPLCPVVLGQDEGEAMCAASSFPGNLTRMWGDKIDNLASGLLDSLSRHIYHRPAIHLAQT
jgi:hypothetical protein